MEELVSVIVPAWNAEKTIKRALNSVARQSYKNYEVLVVDDCSEDNTREIVLGFVSSDSRFRYLSTKVNSGAGMARNHGLLHAKGRFIAFLDADDEWLPHKLEVQVTYMLKNGCYFTFTVYDRIYNNIVRRVSAPGKVGKFKILTNNYIGCLTVVIDRNYSGEIRMPDVRKRQDWLTWIELIDRLGPAVLIRENLAKYHVQKASLSSKKVALIEDTWKVYYRYLSYSFIKSTGFMTLFLFKQFIKKAHVYFNRR